jgi:hypothetical protein
VLVLLFPARCHRQFATKRNDTRKLRVQDSRQPAKQLGVPLVPKCNSGHVFAAAMQHRCRQVAATVWRTLAFDFSMQRSKSPDSRLLGFGFRMHLPDAGSWLLLPVARFMAPSFRFPARRSRFPAFYFQFRIRFGSCVWRIFIY